MTVLSLLHEHSIAVTTVSHNMVPLCLLHVHGVVALELLQGHAVLLDESNI